MIPPAVLARVRRSKAWHATAHHEAGHAVAWVALGYTPLWVALTPGGEGGQLGVCRAPRLGFSARAYPDPTYWPRRRVRADVVATLAGAAAERLVSSRGVRAGAHADAVAVTDLVWDPAELKAFEREAADLVTLHRDAIARVAAALLASDRLRLTGSEVKGVVSGAARPAERPRPG